MTNKSNNSKKIMLYLNKQMTEEELSSFEKELSEDEFLADALEGYKISGALPEDLELIEPDFFSEKKKKKINIKKSLIITAIAACLTFLVIYFIVLEYKSYDNTGKSISQSFFELSIIDDSTQMNDSIDISLPQTNEKHIFISETRIIPEKGIVPESIPPLHINKNIVIQNQNTNITLKSNYQYNSNHYYTYIGNYKVVDYRYDRRINIKSSEIPSNFYALEKYSNEVSGNKTNIAYNDFIKEALDKINEKNFQEAIYDFDIILYQYPNDINATFYKALCLFEINQNEESLKLLEFALANRINTFHEESKWYKSMILKEEKQYAATEKVLLEIINDNGYYGVQARKELDDLYKYYLNE